MGKMGRRGEPRHRPRQEISRCLKYLIFFVNFTFWICGITCTVLGVYLYAKDFRAVYEAIDFFLNPSILLIVCGFIMFIIAFLGCTGALRENVCMLKAFSVCLFFSYVTLVILAFVVFILFYSDTKTGISIQTLLQTGVHKYHDNENMRELMDYLQSNLGCCGAGSQGYKDWNTNQLYNCSPSNPAPEQCGVPPSCCKISNTNSSSSIAAPPLTPTVALPVESGASTTIGSANPRCGFHTQDKSITDLQNYLYTDGCLPPLQRAFEGHAVIIGAVIGAIIVPVCLSVTLSNILAKQVERQRYLLAREARKEEKRRRRNKSKYRGGGGGADPLALTTMTLGADAQLRVARHALENTTAGHMGHRQTSPVSKSNMENKHTMHNPLFSYHDFPKPGPPPEFLYKPKPPMDENFGNHHMPPTAPIYERMPRKRKGGRKSSKPDRRRERRASATPHDRSRYSKSYPNHFSDGARSRSEETLAATYTGPIIVELSSTTHDMPPPQYRQHDVSSAESLGEIGHNKNYP